LRIVLAALGIIACLWGIQFSWRAGLSRLLSVYSRQTLSLNSVNRAVELSPTDPETYDARAQVLFNIGRLDDAVSDVERAVTLRPRDYFLWLELGRARDMIDDEEGAITAFRESVRLAPFYGEPRWQLGNVLYRAGRIDEGFTEMRRASQIDPKFWPVLIDLAWGTFKGDPQAVERTVEPESDTVRLLLSRFFIKHGKVKEGLALIRAVKDLSDKDGAVILTDLFVTRHYVEAFEVWSILNNLNGSQTGRGAITDGSFEGRINLREIGFGWQQRADAEQVRVSLDPGGARDGSRSLLLEFTGNSNPGIPVLYQAVLVEPDTRYTLNFSARTQDIVTGGLPFVTIIDASNKENPVLAQSAALPRGTTDWLDYKLEFTTSKTTEAVIISLHRQGCTSEPCPIFGQIWLDNFVLRKS
ncbi:MAG: tetratricopeptide repeat protein, partial [Acidobacteria bacterium]|nr:tetratricopeptide repeat protein [Acidobacteriota bacterium]